MKKEEELENLEIELNGKKNHYWKLDKEINELLFKINKLQSNPKIFFKHDSENVKKLDEVNYQLMQNVVVIMNPNVNDNEWSESLQKMAIMIEDFVISITNIKNDSKADYFDKIRNDDSDILDDTPVEINDIIHWIGCSKDFQLNDDQSEETIYNDIINTMKQLYWLCHKLKIKSKK